MSLYVPAALHYDVLYYRGYLLMFPKGQRENIHSGILQSLHIRKRDKIAHFQLLIIWHTLDIHTQERILAFVTKWRPGHGHRQNCIGPTWQEWRKAFVGLLASLSFAFGETLALLWLAKAYLLPSAIGSLLRNANVLTLHVPHCA